MKGMLEIHGGFPLNGEIAISGSKFTVIPVIATSLVSGKKIYVKNIPRIRDVNVLMSSLLHLGVSVSFLGNEAVIDSSNLNKQNVPDYLIEQMRGTFLLFPSLLVTRGHASIAIPGGCKLGKRPFDRHIAVIEKFGAKVSFIDGKFTGRLDEIKPARVRFNELYPSPGATKTFLIMSLTANGTSVLENPSLLPEISEFINFLTKLGASIKKEKQSIIVEGGHELMGCDFTIPPDRIECFTWVIATAITRGRTVIKNGSFLFEQCPKELSVLAEQGLIMKKINNSLSVFGETELKGVDNIYTGAYPEFNTDCHPLIVPLLMVSRTPSRLTENIFDGRFKYLEELKRMGGDFSVDKNTIKINPVTRLRGAVVYGHDIRATASVIIAGLSADNKTVILNTDYLERGYENFHEKGVSLGAKIKKVH